VRACATAGDGSMAIEIMKQMLQSRIQPNIMDCNSVCIGAVCVGGFGTLAIGVKSEEQDHVLTPTT
jgi:pentatricopeptide repeat domain (PPR motif)